MNNTKCSGAIISIFVCNNIIMKNTMYGTWFISILKQTGYNGQHNAWCCKHRNPRCINSTMSNTMYGTETIAILTGERFIWITQCVVVQSLQSSAVMEQQATQCKVLESLPSLNRKITMSNTMCSGAIIALFFAPIVQWKT